VPQTQNAFEELSSYSYFDIAETDIFPSQFKAFFSANEIAFNYFNNEHSNLFLAMFWQGYQQQVHNGYLPDVYPYKQSWRF